MGYFLVSTDHCTVHFCIRFRDWRYSLGTIVILLHDVLVTLAVFFLKDAVPSRWKLTLNTLLQPSLR